MGTKFRGIKTAAEHRRGELTKDILRLVAAGVAIGGATVLAPNTVQLIGSFQPDGRLERKKIWNAIKYLEARNRIAIERHNGHDYVTLTHKGRMQLNEEAIWDLSIDEPRRWDQKWRLVMFDFPARNEKVRQAFRIKLEDLGFRMYQKSVFIYPYECHKEIVTVAQWFGVHEHVRYVVATEINDMRDFAKLFDLP